MGYCVSMEVDILIPAEKMGECLDAIEQKTAEKRFSWVNGGPYRGLVDAFKDWRYDAYVDRNNNLKVQYFEGEKWGDDETLFATIAPFVEHGGSATCQGEEGEKWRYLFEHGKLRKQYAELHWVND